jgi:DHA3 family macrolide efflux protein-like MFS transporter
MAVLPQIVAAPFIGPLVDRLDRRMIMIFADSSVAIATGLLMVLFLLDAVQIWHVFIILMIRSLGGAFHQPAMIASTSLLVPEKHLTRVSGLNQALQGIMAIIAPPLGALLIMVLPTQGVLAIDLGTAFFAVLTLVAVRIPSPPRQVAQRSGAAARTTYFHDLLEGLRYIRSWSGLLGLILFAMLLNFLFAPVGSLMPLLVTKDFGLGAIEFAWTETAMGIGAITGGAILSAWGGFKKKIRTTLLGLLGMGIGVMLMGLSPVSLYVGLLAGCFITGFMQTFCNGPVIAIIQSTVNQDMQGRVFSIVNAGAAAMMPLSLLVAGPASDAFGNRIWYVMAGAICILLCLLITSIPQIMNIEENARKINSAESTRA